MVLVVDMEYLHENHACLGHWNIRPFFKTSKYFREDLISALQSGHANSRPQNLVLVVDYLSVPKKNIFFFR